MPDIILLNNTPGLSLSAPYANLSPYITSLYESNGLGFKGFSINDLGPGAVDSFGACCHGFLAICFSEAT
jgi:hypothetical protein